MPRWPTPAQTAPRPDGLNLREAGEARAVIGNCPRRVRPERLTGAERDRVWQRLNCIYRRAQEYTRLTDRELTLVTLLPMDTGGVGPA